MIITGDTSGDLHGSRLVRALKEKDPGLFFFGIGGRALKAAGVKTLVDTSALSVIGVTEIFSKLPVFLSTMNLARVLLKTSPPDLLILIDFPGFNLPLAAIAKHYKVRILYYISPQVWAWRRGRVKKIRRRIDHMAVILPFEVDFYTRHRVPVTFVGHPLLDVYPGGGIPPPPAGGGRGSTIGLLPGSRDQEINRLLPVMLEAGGILQKRFGDVRFLVSQAGSVDPRRFAEILSRYRDRIDCTAVSGGVKNVFERCVLSVVASGTATLEAALCGMPMVIIYKVSFVSYWLGKALVRGADTMRGINHFGLVNLIAGRGLVPELLQGEASAENIAAAVSGMLSDPSGLDGLKRELLGLRDLLGGAGAAQRTASLALGMMEGGDR